MAIFLLLSWKKQALTLRLVEIRPLRVSRCRCKEGWVVESRSRAGRGQSPSQASHPSLTRTPPSRKPLRSTAPACPPREKQFFSGDTEEKVQGAYLMDLGSHQTGQNEALVARLRTRPSSRGASCRGTELAAPPLSSSQQAP